MAQPIIHFAVVEVSKPNIGRNSIRVIESMRSLHGNYR